MSHHTPRYHSGMMGPHARRGVQENPEGRFPPANPNALHWEIQRLNSLLEIERAGRFEDNQRLAHLKEELEEMKLQLQRQTDIKETLISQAEDAKRELERLERFSDPEVIKAVITASKAYKDVKDMKMKPLQQEYVDLKVAHLLSQEAFRAEIHDEKVKSQALQEELDELQTSYEELRSKYEADDALVRQEAETQTFDEERLSEERLLENGRAEKDDKFQEMSQKITFLQDSERLLQEELNQIKSSYNELNCKYESDISGLKQDVETFQQMIQQEETALSKEKKENLIHVINYSALLERVERLNLQLNQERKTNVEKSKKDMELLEKMRAENTVLQEKTTREIQFLQASKKLLKEELNHVKSSYNELNCKYESEVIGLKQDVETYQQKIQQGETALSREKKENLTHEINYSALLERVERLNLQLIQERKTNVDKSEEDMELLEKMRAENTVLQEKTTKEIQFLQEKERSALAELETVNGLYLELNRRYETEVSALKQQYQQEISYMKNDLERVKEDLLLPDTLRSENEDFQQKQIAVFQEQEEDSQNQVDLVKVLNQEVSSEEELPGETLPGCSTDPESPEEIEKPFLAGETIQEDLNNPDTKTTQDGKKKKSKFSFWKTIRNILRLKKPKKKQE
ncbi:WEB family protein At5g16730, chloroplastic-like [Xiphophorus hellerii]|uniref:WEB family protein At5g16730, chloroplastic-like n=1 Tax=Xiphophorus hellerii TaxID=8084 RepID=UPI0013B3FF2D|nr:WEB family protein At5g16730, chloroplastic-like [Xiphophorus hellerii]